MGITLCTIHDILNLADLGFKIPVIVTDVHAVDFEVSAQAYLEVGATLQRKSIFEIGDTKLGVMFRDALFEGKLDATPKEELQEWVPDVSSEQFFMRDVKSGEKILLGSLKLKFRPRTCYYFGYLNDLPQSVGMQNLTQGETTIFFKGEDLLDYKELFSQFSQKEDIPPFDSEVLKVMAVPEITITEHGQFQIEKLNQ